MGLSGHMLEVHDWGLMKDVRVLPVDCGQEYSMYDTHWNGGVDYDPRRLGAREPIPRLVPFETLFQSTSPAPHTLLEVRLFHLHRHLPHRSSACTSADSRQGGLLVQHLSRRV